MIATPTLTTAPSQARIRQLSQLSGMYTHVGVQGAAADTSGHELVSMLFDGLLGAIARARGAMQSGDIQAKSQAIQKALNIVGDGLRGGLNMAQGGSIASDLDSLYGYISMRLTHANLRNDDAALEECSRLVRPLQEAWLHIAPQVRHAA
jgi:flagellar secretion chaperone FliS